MVCVALRCPGELTKDLTFKAKAKDSKFVVEDMPRTTTLPHCSMRWTTRIMPGGWITVHLKDKAELPIKHPLVAREFVAGNFTVQWTKRAFSSTQIDQNMSRTTPALVEMMELLVSLKTQMPGLVGWFQVLKFKDPSKNSKTSSRGANKVTHITMTKLQLCKQSLPRMSVYCWVSWKNLASIFRKRVRIWSS